MPENAKQMTRLHDRVNSQRLNSMYRFTVLAMSLLSRLFDVQHEPHTQPGNDDLHPSHGVIESCCLCRRVACSICSADSNGRYIARIRIRYS